LVYSERRDLKKQAKVADDWMTNVFGLTSIHPGNSKSGSLNTTKIVQPEGTCKNPDVHPAAQKLSDITDYKLDQCNLCNNCQMNGYIGYCLNHQKSQKKKKDNANEIKTGKIKFSESLSDDNTNKKKQHKRFCKFGADYEETPGKGDTPGFECNTSPKITQEGHGFTQHFLFWCPRNTRCMVQKSLFLSQVWRGNVDVKHLLYQSDQNNPNHEDIVSCTAYLVGYKMKGAQTLAIERGKT
jgi:hypothetical protein